MAYPYTHTSSERPKDNNVRRSMLAFYTITGFMLAEVVGGLPPGLLISLADAGHMLIDVTALLFALLVVRFSQCPPAIRRIFGRLRFTTLAAFVSTIVLAVIIVLTIWEAIERFHTSRLAADGIMMVITVASLLANVLTFWVLHHGNEEKNLNVCITTLHVMGDLLGSVGAVIAALAIIWTDWTPADPISLIPISVLILYSAQRLLKDSVNELLKGIPLTLDIAAL